MASLGGAVVDMSVSIGAIDDDNLLTEATLQRIREDFIAQASVTVVLIGRRTWQRKYVDWEIAASLRHTATNPRCGVLGILLPNHPNYSTGQYSPKLIPPRLADNCLGDNPFAKMYDWSTDTAQICEWIHLAFLRRRKEPSPDISRPLFGQNRHGEWRFGWQN